MKYKTKPYKHQEDAVKRYVDKDYGALFCEMGTGKTKIILDIIQNSADLVDVFVTAPNGLHHNWAINEIPTHVHKDVAVYCWKGPIKSKRGNQEFNQFLRSDKSRMFLINIEALRTNAGYKASEQFLLASKNESHFIVDESTCIKNPKAMQTKAVLRLSQNADKRWALNGTPITQSPLDLFTQCRFLSKDCIPYNTYTAFKHTFAIEQTMTMGSRSFRKVVGFQNLEQLTKLLEPFTLRLQKKDCLDLPDKVFEKVIVPMTPEQERIYKSMKKDCIALLDSGELVSTTMALTRIIKLHQISTGFVTTDDDTEHAIDNNRIDALKQIAETTRPLVVFCAYKFNVKQIVKALSSTHRIVTYTGDDSTKEKNEAVRAFQEGEADVFIGTSAAAKGLTLHKDSTMVYFSNNYSLETRLQSQDRIHRIGQNDKCTYIDLIVPSTVDDAILNRLKQKKELSNMVLDDLIEIIK